MSDPKGPFEAAVRAGLEAYSDDIGMREFVAAILTAALPPDPAPETRALVARALCKSRSGWGFSCCQWPSNAGLRHKCRADEGYGDAADDVYRAFRASLLPGEEPS